MIVIGPGAQPTKVADSSLVTARGYTEYTSDHDHVWDNVTFPVVIAHNGHHHFAPTHPVYPEQLQDWRLGFIYMHLYNGYMLFQHLEPHLKNESEEMYNVMKQLGELTVKAGNLIGDRAMQHEMSPVPDLMPDDVWHRLGRMPTYKRKKPPTMPVDPVNYPLDADRPDPPNIDQPPPPLFPDKGHMTRRSTKMTDKEQAKDSAGSDWARRQPDGALLDRLLKNLA